MSQATRCLSYPQRLRVFILSDISNEPDDAESLVRYLLYSNQFDTEGLGAVSSNWMKNRVCPQDMVKIINAYAGAVDNLNAHAHPSAQYPSADSLRALVRSGAPVYGMAAVGDNIPLSDAGNLLLERVLAKDDRPLWVLCWGGTNVLAQVLNRIRRDYPAEEAKALYAKLRVYAISDQDDTGAWIRHTFPSVFYIVSIHAWNQYGLAAWSGMSGEKYYGFDKGGPDFSKLTKEWIKENIQIGPLGSAYPDYMFIPEGDTPTFLYLIQNGLGSSEHPEYGSWGGRYHLHDISSDGACSRNYHDIADLAPGLDGQVHRSNQGTIWRWRDAFQNDFAARMQWTLSNDFRSTNHQPVITLNGNQGLEPVYIEAEAGSTISLDATGTYDPDEGDKLTFKWWHYREPTASQWWIEAEVAELEIKKLDSEGIKVEVTLPPPEKCSVELLSRVAVARGQLLHLILEVTDNGSPALKSYRRVLIQCTNKDLRGGADKPIEAVGDGHMSFA
jgi:hypothetical protein